MNHASECGLGGHRAAGTVETQGNAVDAFPQNQNASPSDGASTKVFVTGRVAMTVVPFFPGRISNWPPSRAIRSFMPWMPTPILNLGRLGCNTYARAIDEYRRDAIHKLEVLRSHHLSEQERTPKVPNAPSNWTITIGSYWDVSEGSFHPLRVLTTLQLKGLAEREGFYCRRYLQLPLNPTLPR